MLPCRMVKAIKIRPVMRVEETIRPHWIPLFARIPIPERKISGRITIAVSIIAGIIIRVGTIIAVATKTIPIKILPDRNLHRIKMSRAVFYIVLFLVFLSGCRFAPNETQEYRHLDEKGWHADSLVRVSLPVIDTAGVYDLCIGLRYTDDYRYSNLWLFITTVSPDSVQTTDTLNCVLADEYGRWLGAGIGALMQQEIPFKSSFRFDKSGIWHVIVQQGMRDILLHGITDVGLKVLPK